MAKRVLVDYLAPVKKPINPGPPPLSREDAIKALAAIVKSLPQPKIDVTPKETLVSLTLPCCVCGMPCLVPFAERSLKTVICEPCNR